MWPRPMAADELAAAVFPSGRPLPPSLRAWLASRHEPPGAARLVRRRRRLRAPSARRSGGGRTGRNVGRNVYPRCRPLSRVLPSPRGSDSRRLLAITEPDADGEYPVLAVDVDDLPFVGLMYPGFDVYLGNTAGLIAHEFDSYDGLDPGSPLPQPHALVMRPPRSAAGVASSTRSETRSEDRARGRVPRRAGPFRSPAGRSRPRGRWGHDGLRGATDGRRAAHGHRNRAQFLVDGDWPLPSEAPAGRAGLHRAGRPQEGA
ncbi:hypothetical protein ACU686_11490 [Yinghuangia aomiensis]